MQVVLATLASFAVPFFAGYTIARTIRRAIGSQLLTTTLFPGAVGAILGPAFSSLCMYGAMNFAGATMAGVVGADLATIASSACLLVWTSPPKRREHTVKREVTVLTRWTRHRALSALLAFTLLSVLYRVVVGGYTSPFGTTDAYTTWNMRARFIFRLGDNWAGSFSPLLYWSLPEYPLLLPTLVARGWLYTGCETQLVPATYALLWSLSGVILVIGTVELLRGRYCAILAGLSILATGLWPLVGSDQSADVPFACTASVAVALLLVGQRLTDRRALLVMAGLAAGSAAWTKNEGLPLIALLPIAGIGLERGPRPGLRRLWDLGWFVSGLIPALLVVTHFKLFLGPPTLLISGLSDPVTIGRILDPARWSIVLGQFLRASLGFFKGGLLLVFLVALLAQRGCILRLRDSAWLCLFLAGMLGVYLFVVVATPHDVTWQAATTSARLLLHLWPSFVILCLLLIDQQSWERLMLVRPRDADRDATVNAGSTLGMNHRT